jgi:hypothetical protein
MPEQAASGFARPGAVLLLAVPFGGEDLAGTALPLGDDLPPVAGVLSEA